jgi:DNA invertase Pin-like site-specific DNA recombinase
MRRRQPDPRLAIGYPRVSTARQAADGISLEHQQDVIRAYCEARGLELVELVVEDGSSAYKQPLHRRDAGSRLVELVQSGQVGAVVALRLDRLFRSMRDAITTVEDWERLGVALHLVDMGGQSLDTSKPLSKMLLAMVAGMAEMESYMKSERTSEAWAYKLARGQRLGGKAPYGYRVDDEGYSRPVPAEQAALTLIREMDAAGEGASAIRQALIDGGHRPRGDDWHLKTINRILAREAEAA